VKSGLWAPENGFGGLTRRRRTSKPVIAAVNRLRDGRRLTAQEAFAHAWSTEWCPREPHWPGPVTRPRRNRPRAGTTA